VFKPADGRALHGVPFPSHGTGTRTHPVGVGFTRRPLSVIGYRHASSRGWLHTASPFSHRVPARIQSGLASHGVSPLSHSVPSFVLKPLEMHHSIIIHTSKMLEMRADMITSVGPWLAAQASCWFIFLTHTRERNPPRSAGLPTYGPLWPRRWYSRRRRRRRRRWCLAAAAPAAPAAAVAEAAALAAAALAATAAATAASSALDVIVAAIPSPEETTRRRSRRTHTSGT